MDIVFNGIKLNFERQLGFQLIMENVSSKPVQENEKHLNTYNKESTKHCHGQTHQVQLC